MFQRTSSPLRVLLGMLLFCWFALPLLPQVAINSPSVTGMTVRAEVHHDVSPPFRDMPVIVPPISFLHEAEPVRLLPLGPGFKPPEAPDSVHQRTAAIAPAGLAPTVNLGFDGLGNGSLGFTVNSAPPDTNGAVGSTQYVQWVNTSFAVFNKSTGALVLGPAAGDTLWQGFGGPCEANNDGDPIAVYDKKANRWLMTQFSVTGGQFFQCV